MDLTISITGCVLGNAYPVVIRQGAACTSAMLQGPEWDAPRGEGITPLTCTGTSGIGLLYNSRLASDPEPWTVGAPSSSDVVGHVLVIEDPITMQPVACGAIAPEMDAGVMTGGPPSDAGAVPSVDIRAEVAGLCAYRQLSPNAQCPDPAMLADCACTHCGLSACLTQCADYVACLEGERDAGCASTCPIDPACSACTGNMRQCLFGFCFDEVACAVPTPGGPCSQVEACCALQGPRAQGCLATIKEIEKLGGDPSCIGSMHDQDFLTHEAYDPPCNFDE